MKGRSEAGSPLTSRPSVGTPASQVVVVGGGLAGMAVAEALARSNGSRVKVTVLEAKRLTGGRAGSFADPVRNETVDYCQHVAMGCCTNLMQLLRRFGMEDMMSRHQSLTFVHPASPTFQFAPSKLLPAPLHLAGVLRSMSFLDWRQRAQILRGMTRLMRTSEQSLRGSTAGCWLRRHGQDDDTIGEFWGTFVVSALGEEVDLVDMSAVRKVMVDGFAAARGASDVLVPTIPLAELFGRLLPQKIVDLGVEIKTGHVVNGIDHCDGKAVVHTSQGPPMLADHVVSTVPWHSVGKLMPETGPLPGLTRFDAIPSSAITGVHLWLDREITPLSLVVLTGALAQWLFRPPWCEEARHTRDHYYQVVISASNKWKSLAKETLIDTVMSDLRRVSSEAAQARVLHSRIVTDPNSVFSIRPEVLELRPTASTLLPWFHLAGDWIDTGWPATMEGAVISGRMAANSIARQQGWQAVEIDAGMPRGRLARTMIRS